MLLCEENKYLVSSLILPADCQVQSTGRRGNTQTYALLDLKGYVAVI